MLFTFGIAALLQLAYAAFALATGAPQQPAGLLPLAWTAWGAIAFHPGGRAWTSAVLAVLAHVLWILLLGLVTLAGVGVARLFGLLS